MKDDEFRVPRIILGKKYNYQKYANRGERGKKKNNAETLILLYEMANMPSLVLSRPRLPLIILHTL